MKNNRGTFGLSVYFFRFLSVKQPPALVFVIDTTGSMFEEITAARLRALSIIQARARNHEPGLPGTFLLIPFHDPSKNRDTFFFLKGNRNIRDCHGMGHTTTKENHLKCMCVCNAK